MKRHLWRLLTACLVLGLCGWPVHAKRVALVIGNDNYAHVSKLEKAGNDATAMAAELKSAGYDVMLYHDLAYRNMVKTMDTFYNSIGGGDEVLVFFAGHGVQTRSGSYLLPTDIEATSESEVERTSYALADLLEQLSWAKATFSLVLVDACRDNPLKSRGRGLAATRGLNPPDPPKGQMVVYSASRGQQALDRLSEKDTNPNGVFTREFIARMRQPGLRIEDLVREVQDSVEGLARTVSHEQRPALYNEARGNFYFFEPVAVAPSSAGGTAGKSVADEAQREDRFWEDTKYAGNRDGFEAYLDLYPKGRYANLARANINRLAAVGTLSTGLSPAGLALVSARPATVPSVPGVAAPDSIATSKPAVPAPQPAVAAVAMPPPPVAALASSATVTTSTQSAEPAVVVAALAPRPKTVSRMTLPNGDRYEGEFANNSFHGKGTQTFASGDVYVGDFQQSVKVGQGSYRYVNGDLYEGGFADNLFQGTGKQTYISGDIYEGEFQRGIKQGQGTYHFANGDRYEGNFADNVFNGRGVMTFASGGRYEGEFRAGAQSGTGTHFYASGDHYVGQFANGVRHGKGVYHFASGQTKELEFENGVEKSN